MLFIGMSSYSQTLPIEYDSMMNKYLSGQLTQVEFRDLSFAWRDLIDSIGYPQVPYDTVSRKVAYEYFSALEGISRETIVNRVSEWAAIAFGSADGLLTRQDNSSRLILSGSIELLFPDLKMVYKNAWRGYVESEQENSSICFFTLVFTMKDGKMKSQVKNLSYEYTNFESDRTISRPLNSCFPISSREQDEWKALITLVNETSRGLEDMINVLVKYIKDYEHDYHW
jgi:hypothetical protein